MRPAIAPVCLAALVASMVLACGSDNTPASTTGTNTSPTNTNTNGGNGGGTGTNTNTASTPVNLPVQLMPVPWDSAANSLDASLISVEVGDPAPVFKGAATQVTWTNTQAVPASSCSTNAGVRTCMVTITGIDTSAYTVGMLVRTLDSRASYSDNGWQAIATGVAQTTLTALQQGATVAANPAFISTTQNNQLSTWSGISKLDIIGNGALVGLIVDKNNQPVLGAQVTIPDSDVTVKYANSDFSGSTTSPAATGQPTPWFIATPESKRVVQGATWTITAPNSSVTWKVPLVGSAPGLIAFVPFPGQ